ncbi:hypothetical protein E8E11_006296 [Didymella keratinophila]|nr:hypothetical protein E8E11_006296 [Didymella keratinophila]
MSPGIPGFSDGAPEAAQSVPSSQSSPLSSQLETLRNAQPKTSRHDLANMALLFAMDGNYPGCWLGLDDDQDQDKAQNSELNAEEGQLPNQGDVNEETADDRLFSKTRQLGKEMEKRSPLANTLSLILHTRLLKGHNVKDRKSMIPRPISAFTSAASPRNESRVEYWGERLETSMSYVPTGAPRDSDIFPPDEKEGGVCGWYDELGFLMEESHVEDRFITTQKEVQQQKQQPSQPASPSQQEERYVRFVAETGVSLDLPFVLQDNKPEAARQSSFSDLEVAECSIPPAERPPPLSLRSRLEETKTKLQALVLDEKVRSDNNPTYVQPSIHETSDLHIPGQHALRPEGFVPFLEFIQEPGRFLRNAKKLRRQKERRRALYEANRAARGDIQGGVVLSSRGTNMADLHAKVRVERSVTLFSWKSGMTDRFETSRTEAIDSVKIRRYELARERSVERSRNDATYLISTEKSDSGLEGVCREMAEQGFTSQRTEPLEPSRNAWWEPDIHPHILEAVEEQLNEHLSEDLWSFIEGDDRDFTVVQQRQGMIHELPEKWRQRASEHSLTPLNRYEYVQYDAQILYDPTQWPEERETDVRQDDLSPGRCPSCLSWPPAQNCSLCWTVHTQESVIDPSYPPMRVWDTVRVEGNEDGKRLPSETSSQTTVKKPVWCWPFSRTRCAVDPKKEVANHTGDAGKGLWKRKAKRRKLSKIPPTPKD